MKNIEFCGIEIVKTMVKIQLRAPNKCLVAAAFRSSSVDKATCRSNEA